MIFATDAGSILSVATGILLAAMGSYIWAAAPRTRQNRALAAFTAGWGANVITGWIFNHEAPFAFAFSIVTAGIFSPIVAGAAWLLARDVGGRDEAKVERRRSWWVLALALLPLPSAILLGLPTTDLEGWPDGGIARWAAAVLGGSLTLMFAGIVVLLFLATLRYPTLARKRPQAANTVLLLTFGLGSYLAVAYTFPPSPAFIVFDGWRGTAQWAWVITANATVLVLAMLWLRNTAKSPAPFAGRARWATWTVLAFMLVSFILPYLNGIWIDENPGALAAVGILTSAARFLAIAMFTYAILRNQLLGIDVKLRWGISRSTIAAAFVTIFFIASEGAQIVFGQKNELVGLGAAGALVFAIAPLQRAAERLAAKAVPISSPVATTPQGAAAGPDPEETYRKTLRLAMRDRYLTPDERVHLAEVAEAFGISAGRAAALVREAERETEAAP